MAMAITDWPAQERPRERLLEHGAHALSDAELLAIFLRTGVSGKSAVDLARELLHAFGSLTTLTQTRLDAFCAMPGLGPAKYAQLQAVMEMARRVLKEQAKLRDALTSPQAVRDYLRLQLASLEYEVFMAVFLDTQNRVIAMEELFRGSLRETSVYPREVVKRALHLNASALIFAHNHPSGVAEPSAADTAITRTLKQALALVDVRVLDHFIVAAGGGVSLAERGLV